MENELLDYETWQQIASALDNAVALRESGEGGGHAALIQELNLIGLRPMSSQEAERVARQVLERGYNQKFQGPAACKDF